jgi:hypothetical protein
MVYGFILSERVDIGVRSGLDRSNGIVFVDAGRFGGGIGPRIVANDAT